MLIVLVVALPVGVYAAVRRGTTLDYTARAFAALGQAVPPFWLGLVLVLIFGVLLHCCRRPVAARRSTSSCPGSRSAGSRSRGSCA